MSGKIIRNRGGSIFVVFVGIPPPKFTSSTKRNFDRFISPTKT